MDTLTLEIDGKEYSAPATLGLSLESFLRQAGAQEVPEILVSDSGSRVVPAFSLVSSLESQKYSSSEDLTPVPALTTEELLTRV